MSHLFKHCPICTADMGLGLLGYNYCSAETCDFIQYQNPTPVVAAVVEYGSNQLILAHNVTWPAGWFGLITGFVEKNEHPDYTIVREVKEELGLDCKIESFIGHYKFERMNQLIIAYHVIAERTEIVLDDELDDFRIMPFSKAKYWPAGTGYALRDFLSAKGYHPAMLEFNK